jgi:SET domain-containing protein
MLNPNCPTKISAGMMGKSKQRGFGIAARTNIPAGTYCLEVIGLMTSDLSNNHTELSVIAPYVSNTGPQERRPMIGPLRFVNHRCKTANAEVSTWSPILLHEIYKMYQWIAIDHSDAFILCTKLAIKEGEEIFVDYGETYFKDGECPCETCGEEA